MSFITQLTAAEALAKAALSLFPGSFLIHLKIDAASYSYDIAFSQQVNSYAIPFLEECMREIIKQQIPIQILDMMRENASQLLEHHQQPFKAQQIANDLYNIVQIVKIDHFYDYLPLSEIRQLQNLHTGYAGAIKLFSIQEGNSPQNFDNYKVLTVSGTAAENKQSLKQLVKKHELSKQNNPIRLGAEMNLFIFDPKLGPAGLFWSPKGVFLRDSLFQLWHENSKQRHFQFVMTPPAAPLEFLNKFPPSSLSFKNNPECAQLVDKTPLLAHYLSLFSHSLNEFPVKIAEWSNKIETISWWDEPPAPYLQSGDYRQIYCLEEQVQQEVISSLHFFNKTLIMLGFRCEWVLLSSKGKSFVGNQQWANQSLDYLKKALLACGFSFSENKTELLLTGPRIEVRVKDILDRNLTISTLEINLAYTQYLALCYRENRKVFLLCESLFTSLEKVIALLLEHSGGVLPLALAPEQIRILPIGKQLIYANKVSNQLKEAQLRVSIDLKDDPLGHKIHRAEKERIPFQVIVGEKESKDNKIAIRAYGQKALKKTVSLEAFIKELCAPKTE